ncbi:MAG: hypothetical protein ACR2HY_07605 [Acidimicrobiales bacterium]
MTEVDESYREDRPCGDGTSGNAGRRGPAKEQSSLYLTGTFYLTMVAAGYVIEAAFGLLHLVPSGRHAKVTEAAITWNYTTFLNLLAIAFTAALLVRFVRTGGAGMSR